MKKQTSIERMAGKLRSEIYGNNTARARRLFGDVPQGAQEMTKPKYLDYVTRNLGDTKFLAALALRVGPVMFRETLIEAAGATAADWPLPEGMKIG